MVKKRYRLIGTATLRELGAAPFLAGYLGDVHLTVTENLAPQAPSDRAAL